MASWRSLRTPAIGGAIQPHTMQDDRQFSGYSYDRTLVTALFGQLHPPDC